MVDSTIARIRAALNDCLHVVAIDRSCGQDVKSMRLRTWLQVAFMLLDDDPVARSIIVHAYEALDFEASRNSEKSENEVSQKQNGNV